jgi:hypothetical protein
LLVAFPCASAKAAIALLRFSPALPLISPGEKCARASNISALIKSGLMVFFDANDTSN